MSPPQERAAIYARVSIEAHDAIREFCARQGVTISGLMQALGEFCTNEPERLDRSQAIKTIIEAARQVDAERRHS